MTPGEFLVSVAVAAVVIVVHALWHDWQARRGETAQDRSARVLRELNEDQ